jgi:tRNA threonylcarbamoyladenosine biosynthesis protein TsaE
MHLASKSPDDTRAIAARFARVLLEQMPGRDRALVVALRGELGAGKTTFTQGVAAALNIPERPRSPTFTLMKEYAIPDTPYRLWHLDCYRLTGHADLVPLDLHAQFANPNNIILIEWPERVGDGLPTDHIDVRFSHEGDDVRSLTIPL